LALGKDIQQEGASKHDSLRKSTHVQVSAQSQAHWRSQLETPDELTRRSQRNIFFFAQLGFCFELVPGAQTRDGLSGCVCGAAATRDNGSSDDSEPGRWACLFFFLLHQLEDVSGERGGPRLLLLPRCAREWAWPSRSHQLLRPAGEKPG
jgi:hypothetical protein